MKIIQAMKQIKDLQRKADDLKSKVKLCCADMNYETPMVVKINNDNKLMNGYRLMTIF